MALTDVQKAIAAEQARIAAEKAAADTAAAQAAAEAKAAAELQSKKSAKTKAEKDLVKKEAEYKKLITQLAKGGMTDRAAATLQGQAIVLSDQIDALKVKLGKTPEVTSVPKIDTTIGPKPTATPKKAETPIAAATDETPGAKVITPTPTFAQTPTAAAGAKPFSQPMTIAGAGIMGTPDLTSGGKIDSAIAKAIELYQMPDIIFNNVPELKAILERYLDPKKPITLDQFIKEVGNSTWYRQNSKTIQNRYLQKFNYDELKKQGKAIGTTQYEQDIKRITESVIAKARELGAFDYTDPTAAQLIAEDLYVHNMEADATALTKRLAGGIRMGALGTGGLKGYTGQAQSNYQALLALAKNNGLSLRNILPSRIAGANDEELTNNVLKGLADGSIDPTVIEQTARTLAAQGQPQYIKDLLAQGYNLSDVYAPYKKTMATVLELNPDQIDLNDPTLRMAITPNGDMNVYEYTKLLRKDNRWQYTQQANTEVADATKQILQDFGFMG